MSNPFSFVNRRGSALITSASVQVGADSVIFSFPNHSFVNAYYQGTVYVNLAQAIPTGTTGTLPVLFETNGATQPLTRHNGEAATAADITGTGVYALWFDRRTNTLQILNQ